MVMLPIDTSAVASSNIPPNVLPVSYGANPSGVSGTSSADAASALAQQWSYLTGDIALPPVTKDVPQPTNSPSSPAQNSFTPLRIQ
jgi:hypothetical protein